jgi:hypothetical protein
MKTEPDSKKPFFTKQFPLLSGSPSLAVTRKRVAAFCFTKRSVHGQQ